MGFITWATSPWGQSVPMHIAWYLIWVAVIAGFFFMIVHALYVAHGGAAQDVCESAKPRETRRRFPSACRATRWPRGSFTGSWRSPCSRC